MKILICLLQSKFNTQEFFPAFTTSPPLQSPSSPSLPSLLPTPLLLSLHSPPSLPLSFPPFPSSFPYHSSPLFSQPSTSFLWITSPLKTCQFIIWKHYKWHIILVAMVMFLVMFLVIAIFSFPVIVNLLLFNNCN